MPHRAPGSRDNPASSICPESRFAITARVAAPDITASDRRRISGVQRGAPRRGVPHLHGQDAAARERYDDRAHRRRSAHPGRSWRVHRRADGARARRLCYQHRRQPLSRSALRAELHAASRSPFVNDVELYEEGVIRIYDVLFPSTVLLETDSYIRDFLVRSGLNGPVSTAELHYALGRDLMIAHPGCETYSVVAARGAAAGVPIYTSSPGDSSIGMNIAYHELMNDSRSDGRSEQGRQRGVRVHPGW